jgi:hypothetical protein
MVKFYRPNFASGVIVLKEQVAETSEYLSHKFYIKDQGKNFEFQNEPYLLQKYPAIFTQVR